MSKYTDGNSPILSDEEMQNLGFIDRGDFWYYCKGVLLNEKQRATSTTLNISIEKATGNYDELVMNEMFGQPEYYGNMREPYRSTVMNNVNAELVKFNQAGLTIAVDHSLYGVNS